MKKLEKILGTIASLFSKAFKINKEKTKEFLIELLIRAIKIKPTEADLRLFETVKKLAKEKCIRGDNHLICGILAASGKYYYGLQQTYSRFSDGETCAEPMAKGNLKFEADTAVTIVTIHFYSIPEKEDGGVTTISPPCSICAGRLLHLQERQKARGKGDKLGTLLYHKKEIIKVHAEFLSFFRYAIGYNEDLTARTV